MRIPLEVNVPTATINITLPANTPLMCDIDEAERLFGISRTTLYGLAKAYPDFPVKKIGRGARYLVLDLYAWFRDYPDRIIPTNEKATQWTAEWRERKSNGHT